MEKKKLSEGFKEALLKATGDEIKVVAEKILNAYGTLEASHAEQAAENATLLAQVQTATGIIEEQSQKIEQSRRNNPNFRPTLEIKGKYYRINHAVRNAAGEVLTIEAIAQDTKLVAELIKGGSTAVKELTKEEFELQ